MSKEKESWYEYNISSNRKSKEKMAKTDKNKENKNLKNDNQISNNKHYKNKDIISYFKNLKNENSINNINLKKFSNRTNYNNNYNYKTSTSFYTKKSHIISPSISSVMTDNINCKTTHNFNKKKKSGKKNIKNINTSKSIKNLNSSKISKTPSSKIIKSVKSIEDNPTASLQMLNLLNNDNKYETQYNNEMFKHIKKNEYNKIKNKRDINFIGKEKIQDKYNLYFNCFMPDLYEEQKEKLLNEKNYFSRMKKSKSTTKLEVLEDDIGPNLYNEKIDMPDIGYIIYKTNKKINSNYSLNSINTLNSNFSNYNNNNNYDYENQNLNFNSKRSINTINNPVIHNSKYGCLNNNQINLNNNDNNKNDTEFVDGTNISKKDSSNFFSNRGKDNFFSGNLSENRNKNINDNLNNELIKERLYKEIYNKAFKIFNYQPNSYFQDYSNKNLKL